MPESVRHVMRWIETAMFAAGVGCLAWACLTWASAAIIQLQAKAQMEQALTIAPADGARRLDVGNPAGPVGSLIGLLEIPRLGVSVAVLEGDDDRTLRVAVGHLPDTALPWEAGNSAFAAHRDTFFRPIERIRVGDAMRLTTPHGELEYRVRRLSVVDPENVWVLNPSEHAGLTLITCYPFRFVGPAPKRYIVQAERLAGVE